MSRRTRKIDRRKNGPTPSRKHAQQKNVAYCNSCGEIEMDLAALLELGPDYARLWQELTEKHVDGVFKAGPAAELGALDRQTVRSFALKVAVWQILGEMEPADVDEYLMNIVKEREELADDIARTAARDISCETL